MPWYERIEQSIDCNLISEADAAEGYYAKFNPNGLMRGVAKDRAEFYKALWDMGALNANEIREMEELNPYSGGDTYRVLQNMVDASLPAPTQQQPAPAPAPGADPAKQQQRLNVGRVLSARNESRIRGAQSQLQEVLSELDQEQQE
jgi:hypothetical protein